MKVAVLSGGRSSEHDVSLASAKAVLDGLEAAGHECRPIVIDHEGAWWAQDPRGTGTDRRVPARGDRLALEPGSGVLGADVVFPVLHGAFGEDGTVQGLLECVDIPYVGAGVLASAVCMDKATFKRLMAEAGIPQVRYEIVREPEWKASRHAVLDRARGLGSAVFVKPSRMGSSFGISRVTSETELPDALDRAFRHDPCALVEAAAGGKEVECSVIGNEDPLTSEPGQVVAKRDWYDYESKYTEGGMELVVPAPINAAQRERVKRLAAEAFRLSSCSGLARVDFFVTDEGQVLVNELNTIPGFTAMSVFAKLFEASGIPYVDLLDRLLGYALERHENERRHIY
jgi:D-alanine-D-alanine ligase